MVRALGFQPSDIYQHPKAAIGLGAALYMEGDEEPLERVGGGMEITGWV